MPYVPAKGHTLFIPSGSTDHLFVVLTPPIGVVSNHLLANFSSIKLGIPHDTSCLVNVGDHSFITMPSYIEYQFARIEVLVR
jgi:hypothetical protein